MGEKGRGVWIPEDVIKEWESLHLAPSSTWNVLMALANQQYRYGGVEARITLHVVAKRTGHSLSTVKRSVARLQDVKQLVKLGRGRWQLVGVNMVTPTRPPEQKRERVSMVAPSRGHDHEPFTILLFSIDKKNRNNDAKAVFTDPQLHTLNSVYREILELYGDDVLSLAVAASSGDATPKTYDDWLREIVETRDRKEAGRFVRALLKLLKDERIAGRELE